MTSRRLDKQAPLSAVRIRSRTYPLSSLLSLLFSLFSFFLLLFPPYTWLLCSLKLRTSRLSPLPGSQLLLAVLGALAAAKTLHDYDLNARTQDSNAPHARTHARRLKLSTLLRGSRFSSTHFSNVSKRSRFYHGRETRCHGVLWPHSLSLMFSNAPRHRLTASITTHCHAFLRLFNRIKSLLHRFTLV